MSEECVQLQEEEREVLRSIYEGDNQFSVLSDTQYQYKYGEDGTAKSFILDLTWGPTYPVEELPKISLDIFYNRHLLSCIKAEILKSVEEEAQQYLGMSMTYTLFEHVKENVDTLLANQTEIEIAADDRSLCDTLEEASLQDDASRGKSPRKEQLTKAQKRRMWDKGGLDTEDRPRGWDWTDVIRHLSQTGAKE